MPLLALEEQHRPGGDGGGARCGRGGAAEPSLSNATKDELLIKKRPRKRKGRRKKGVCLRKIA